MAIGADERVARAEEVLRAYALSEGGWRRSPGQNLQELLVDLMQWCDATQHGFERALTAAREARRAGGAGGGSAGGDNGGCGDGGGGGQASAG
ncbi:hypothetical protein DY245_27510 [Streptomyces inhibens]|uniref:Uncharacterized protein n=1 Tax=Streptomyces inhibens TaxID=2293571 RepID=A0A371PYZ4_STRIH|nr:hypothetical protein [Streptomyces inhibens]REK87323.1 hypothetical protein DY245_27510 [Streptomyces inhibens]